MKRSGWPTMRSVTLAVVVAAGLIGMSAVGASAKTTLTVYTAIEADDLKKYAARFNEDHPDIEIKWVRDSTGVVTAKLLAEKANPQADVIWGLAATSLMVLKTEGMLMPYAPKGVEKLDAQFRDKANPPRVGRHGRLGRPRSASTRPRPQEGPARADLVEGPDQACLQGPGRDAEPGVLGHRASWTYRAGSRSSARPRAGSTWTRCTRTSPSTRTPAPSPARWRAQGEYADRRRRSSSARLGSRSRARRSTSSSPRRSRAGTWRRPRSSRAPRTSRPPRRWSTGR